MPIAIQQKKQTIVVRCHLRLEQIRYLVAAKIIGFKSDDALTLISSVGYSKESMAQALLLPQ